MFTLSFGIHNHQPVGNFDSVFRAAHRDAYHPFLELLKENPNFRMSLHQSGILWRWQQEFEPAYLKLVKQLVDTEQLEPMTGGFYEPILTSIPERDALGQIQMLTSWLRTTFGAMPRGLWLTERIWEPHLPKLLHDAEVSYLPVDDTHFLYAGFEREQLGGAYVTEEEGKSVRLLPIQKRLRYLIPFGKVEEVINELKSQAEREPHGVAVYADDGEKFGVWPHTHKHCYEDGWLRRFFEAIEKNNDWLQVAPLGEAAQREPLGRAYLPSSSYAEMLHWSLPPRTFIEYERFEHWLAEEGKQERWGRFVRGGHWRGFLSKYEEANMMHKRMLRVSQKLSRHTLTPELATQALEKLYAAQCNCPYWHGVFGGLYLPHIRQAIYANIITAEKLIRQDGKVTFEHVDYDADGHKELVVETDYLTAIFTPRRGGMMTHLSLMQPAFELTDTLSRRKEGYHLKLSQANQTDGQTASIHDQVVAKEPGLEKYLVEDWYLKRCFIDHFLSERTSIDDFAKATYGEDGDFVTGSYEQTIQKDALTLSRDGGLWQDKGMKKVTVSKSFSFGLRTSELAVEYQLRCPGATKVPVRFAVENNFTFQAGHADDRYVLVNGKKPKEVWLDALGDTKGVHDVGMVDEYQRLQIVWESETAAQLWRMPIYTVSLSEGGFEKVYQGTTLLMLFELTLNDRPVTLKMRLRCGTT